MILDPEGCVPAYEGAVTEGETTTTATGIEEATDTLKDNDANSENSVIDEGLSIADICGDNIDNDADGQMDVLFRRLCSSI